MHCWEKFILATNWAETLKACHDLRHLSKEQCKDCYDHLPSFMYKYALHRYLVVPGMAGWRRGIQMQTKTQINHKYKYKHKYKYRCQYKLKYKYADLPVPMLPGLRELFPSPNCPLALSQTPWPDKFNLWIRILFSSKYIQNSVFKSLSNPLTCSHI